MSADFHSAKLQIYEVANEIPCIYSYCNWLLANIATSYLPGYETYHVISYRLHYRRCSYYLWYGCTLLYDVQ